MKKFVILIVLALFIINFAFAQDASNENKPVSGTYNSGIFLENQTVLMYPAKTIEFVINHRFGKIGDGGSAAYGLYSPSNIRLGLNYSILNNLQVGIGATKYRNMDDLNIKYGILEQTTNGKIPVSLGCYGNVTYDDSKNYDYANFKEGHRYSYMAELMISRKFCNYFNLQIAPMYTHYNIVEYASDSISPVRKNDNFGLSVLAKLNITSTLSFFCEYDQNFTKLLKKTSTYKDPEPNFAFGIENATAAHSFQIFLTTAGDISYQRNMVYGQNSLSGKDGYKNLMIGFNITRVFYR